MKRIAVFSMLLGVAGAVGAQQMGGQGMMGGQAGAGAGVGAGQPGTGQMGGQGMMGEKAVPLADGEVRRVDKNAKKLTLRHGAIPHMDMPPMTMVYQVGDPAMLDQVKAGDKVKFAADKVNGAF